MYLLQDFIIETYIEITYELDNTIDALTKRLIEREAILYKLEKDQYQAIHSEVLKHNIEDNKIEILYGLVDAIFNFNSEDSLSFFEHY